MKYAIHFLAFTLVGWPSLIVGYLCAAARSGFGTGIFMHDRHEDAAIKHWLPAAKDGAGESLSSTPSGVAGKESKSFLSVGRAPAAGLGE